MTTRLKVEITACLLGVAAWTIWAFSCVPGTCLQRSGTAMAALWVGCISVGIYFMWSYSHA